LKRKKAKFEETEEEIAQMPGAYVAGGLKAAWDFGVGTFKLLTGIFGASWQEETVSETVEGVLELPDFISETYSNWDQLSGEEKGYRLTTLGFFAYSILKPKAKEVNKSTVTPQRDLIEQTVTKEGTPKEIKSGGGEISDPIETRNYDRPTIPDKDRAHAFGPGLGSSDPFTLYLDPWVNRSLMAYFEIRFRKEYQLHGPGGELKYRVFGPTLDDPTHLEWRWKPKGATDWTLELTLDLKNPGTFTPASILKMELRGMFW
jgi:hypothetical protein